MAYKGMSHIEHIQVAVPALDEWAKEQEDTGLVTQRLDGQNPGSGTFLSRVAEELHSVLGGSGGPPFRIIVSSLMTKLILHITSQVIPNKKHRQTKRYEDQSESNSSASSRSSSSVISNSPASFDSDFGSAAGSLVSTVSATGGGFRRSIYWIAMRSLAAGNVCKANLEASISVWYHPNWRL
jgi:hypothetical protein